MIGFVIALLLVSFVMFILCGSWGVLEGDEVSLIYAVVLAAYIMSTVFTMMATHDYIINSQFDCITNNNITTCVQKPEKKEKE